jgi:hypothetical protein
VGVNIEKLAWKKEVKILCVGFREVSLEEGRQKFICGKKAARDDAIPKKPRKERVGL